MNDHTYVKMQHKAIDQRRKRRRKQNMCKRNDQIVNLNIKAQSHIPIKKKIPHYSFFG